MISMSNATVPFFIFLSSYKRDLRKSELVLDDHRRRRNQQPILQPLSPLNYRHPHPTLNPVHQLLIQILPIHLGFGEIELSQLSKRLQHGVFGGSSLCFHGGVSVTVRYGVDDGVNDFEDVVERSFEKRIHLSNAVLRSLVVLRLDSIVDTGSEVESVLDKDSSERWDGEMTIFFSSGFSIGTFGNQFFPRSEREFRHGRSEFVVVEVLGSTRVRRDGEFGDAAERGRGGDVLDFDIGFLEVGFFVEMDLLKGVLKKFGDVRHDGKSLVMVGINGFGVVVDVHGKEGGRNGMILKVA